MLLQDVALPGQDGGLQGPFELVAYCGQASQPASRISANLMPLLALQVALETMGGQTDFSGRTNETNPPIPVDCRAQGHV